MQLDPGSNYILESEIAPESQSPGAVNGAGVDHNMGDSVSFFIDFGDKGVAGTLDAKVQYATQSDFSDAVDYPADDPAGNDAAITQLTDVGTAQLNVPNPRARYTRVVATGGANDVVFSVASVLGPKRHRVV